MFDPDDDLDDLDALDLIDELDEYEDLDDEDSYDADSFEGGAPYEEEKKPRDWAEDRYRGEGEEEVDRLWRGQ